MSLQRTGTRNGVMNGSGADVNFDATCREIALLTDRMLACARSQEWEGIGGFETRRRQLFEHLLGDTGSGPPDAARARRVADVIRDVLERDRELIRLGEVGRKEALEILGAIQEGKRARRAYENP
jgi:hypothetical protein